MDGEPVAPGPTVEVIDPDVRAHVYSLVTALGGFNNPEDADRYALGDDALACLRDIKRWLKLYDEKNNRMDVARCLGEANLVNGDLIPILALWSNSQQKSKHFSRIALACLELLVPLTWPLEMPTEATYNHHRHIPYLRQTHISYKRQILSHGSSNLLRTVIQIALPSMAVTRSERSGRDEGILKLMLYFLRNVALITPNARLAAEGDEEETSRSATINAFHHQDIFALLLTMCSNVGDDFNMQDIVLLEILFHIVKGVNVDKLFMNDEQRSAKRTDELDGLLRQESSLRREYAKNAPTRHGRFGTMIWVKRDDAKVSTVSGQNVLKDSQTTLHKMDESKKWNKPQPRRRQPTTSVNNDFSTPAYLNSDASHNLRIFVEEFLDSGFNPLFTHVRKAIEREADRVLDINSRHFFYTAAWFLEAERARRYRKRERRLQEMRSAKEPEADSFGLIAGVLNQETFIFLNRSMQSSFDNKDWEDLNAAMRCFTQILLTVQEMAKSPLDEDQEISENIQNRIFYEETTHDRIIAIIRGYKDQGFGYLDASTELAHVFLRMLEQYSKKNIDMQVRSQRRKRKNKNIKQNHAAENEGEENESEDEDSIDPGKVSNERKFDFKRFASKFCNQKCVDTFVAFTKFYRELDTEQLKRAHRYFYRVGFKQDMVVLLFRVDIINMFYRMIKGPGALDSSQPVFREWEELVRQIIRQLIKKIEQRPLLIVELLFSKINSTAMYLEHGHEKQTISSTKKQAPVELEVNGEKTIEEKIDVVVGAMVLDEQTDLVKWVGDVLGSASEEKEAFEAREEAQRESGLETESTPNPLIEVIARDDACKRAMFSNAKLRLLMTLVGFERRGGLDNPAATWFIPGAITSREAKESKSTIERSLDKPVDGDDPRKMLRNKSTQENTPRNHQTTLDVNFGSESEGEEIPDGPLFPPNPRSKTNALDELKKKRKKRAKPDENEKDPLDPEVAEQRREARRANADARLRKIKSDLYVHDSDEESNVEADEEFFLLEEKRREDQAERVKHALLTGRIEEAGKRAPKSGRKRQSTVNQSRNADAQSKRQRRKNMAVGLDGADDDIIMGGIDDTLQRDGSASQDAENHSDTPLSPLEDGLDFDDDLAFSRNREKNIGPFQSGKGSSPDSHDEVERAEAKDDDDGLVAAPTRRRMRAGFVVDSDSE